MGIMVCSLTLTLNYGNYGIFLILVITTIITIIILIIIMNNYYITLIILIISIALNPKPGHAGLISSAIVGGKLLQAPTRRSWPPRASCSCVLPAFRV